MASERAKRELASYIRQGQTEPLQVTTAGQEARPIDAVVDRKPPEPYGDASHGVIELQVLHDADLGVLATFDQGTTTFRVAKRVGGTPDERLVATIVSQDPDWLHLKLA